MIKMICTKFHAFTIKCTILSCGHFSLHYGPIPRQRTNHGADLPLSVIDHLKPIYQSLSSQDLLEKCLHGKTRNQI